MTPLDYHRLKNAERAFWKPAKLEAAMHAEGSDFPAQVEALLPPPEEEYYSRASWPHYQKFYDLCVLYQTATEAQRAYIRSKMNWARAFQLGHFRMQAQEIAVQNNSQEMLQLALVALAIGDFNVGDARDSILAVQSIYKTAGEISADWKTLVTSVVEISGNGMAALLADFLARHPTT